MARRLVTGRIWNSLDVCIMIVAAVNEERDWAAYIGCASPKTTERKGQEFVSTQGAKLSEGDARFIFPTFKEPYRR